MSLHKLLQCITLLLLPLPALSAPASKSSKASRSPEGIVQAAQETYEANTLVLLDESNPNCTAENIIVRRAWDDLSVTEREEYIQAALCLYTIPSRTNKDLVPGARTLFDDFTYSHIAVSNYIHQSSLLFPWHRHFMWSYEQALRNECGYKGALPYWAWERHSNDQSQSPVFQPGHASFGTNGAFIPSGPSNKSTVGVDPPIFIYRPAGTGGGCISDGPFANVPVNLGPVDVANSPDNKFGTQYNPRCLLRDFYQPYSTNNLTYSAIANLLQMTSIHDFHPAVENGIHIGSHGYIGGQESDFYASPNDPVFYLLHAQIDRVWSLWQGQDYESRKDALDGTVTVFNRPPSENGTLDTVMHFGEVLGGDLRIGDAMSTVGGAYCYMYA